MSKALYMDDSYLKEFESEVLEANGQEIVLRETAFYPSSGGQPNDTGTIKKDDEEYEVIDVKKAQGKIIHVVNKEGLQEKDKIKGIPDLIIEVLSPSNAYYDLVHKKNIYEETGVKEFWTVDSEGKGIEVYENVDGKFILFSKSRSKGTVESKLLPGFRVTSEELFVEK